VISFALLWLRAAGLIGQTMALGSTAFALVVLAWPRQPDVHHRVRSTLTIAAVGALICAAAQAVSLALIASAFADEHGWPFGALFASTVGQWGAARLVIALGVAGAALAARRTSGSRVWSGLLVAAGGVLALSGALVGHAAGREASGWLVAIGALHQAAAGVWVGGLLCAFVFTVRPDAQAPIGWLRPFSRLAATSVGAIALTGAALTWAYVGTPRLAIGTSYGAMVLAKITLFVALLVMGAFNHFALRRHPASPAGEAIVLRRRVEVEAGLGLVTIILAASVASAPPSVDPGVARATPAEVLHLFTPRWPRLDTPTPAELLATSGLGDPDAPRSPEEIAWSEFGHNVSGLFIVAMGVLATLERTGRAPWARHWPLLLIGLAGFIGWSLDPEGWQTGAVGFWEQLRSPEVVQHRILLLLTTLFAFAEWQVRSGRRPSSRLRYLFPIAAIASGVLLLAHSHEVSNAQSALFMEISHLPLGLVSLLAGWSRWLEIRLPPSDGGGPGRLWGPAFCLFGLILTFYRET
jgi:putative copper resistance protein D